MENSKNISSAYERNRRYNTIIFFSMFFAVGLESVLTISTLWAYLSTLVHPENKHVWYGMISSSYTVMDIISSLVLGQYIDRTRNIRLVILCCICFIIAGNIIYLFHFSPYCLLLGRIMSGIGAGWRPCVVGETSRMYDRDERSKRLALLVSSYTLATTVAPGINIMFTNVRFHIMSLQFTYANIPGIYASIIFFTIQMFAYFKLSNLNTDDQFTSEIETLQERDCPNTEMQDDTTGQMRKEGRKNKSEKQSIWSFIASLSRSIDIILIFLGTFSFQYIKYDIDMWVPILIRDDLKWNQNFVYVTFVATGVVYIIFMIPVSIKKLSFSQVFKMYLCNTLMYFITMASILILFLYQKNKTLDIALTSLYVVTFGISQGANILLVSMLSLFLQDSAVSRGESIRIFFTRSGTLLGTLLGGMTYPFIPIIVPFMMVVRIILYVGFIIRYRSFTNPVPAF